jgi:hypothetical protein
VRRKCPRPHEALEEAFVRSAQSSGVYGDGNCSYRRVKPSGAKPCILRTVVEGRRRDLGWVAPPQFLLRKLTSRHEPIAQLPETEGIPS